MTVERPNPQYAVLMQEQLGGGNGELKAAMQYISQSFRIKDPEIKDLLLDKGAEELSHMEMVAQTINLLNGHDVNNTEDSKLYFDLSTPGPSHEAPNPTPPSFENPRK
ncbi:manganese catalase family protein [Clostridium sp. UBA3061]|uniref:manganese catalase family protein n=1 Tax=Clostridium sp. UBA3061 TaxID=1946353 RepID=UPI0032164EFE